MAEQEHNPAVVEQAGRENAGAHDACAGASGVNASGVDAMCAGDSWPQLLGRLQKLREPFPPQVVSFRQNDGELIPYVGHAETTDRLLSADLCWTWEPFALDANGAPLLERDEQNRPVGLWIRLTVCGVTRPGYGSCPPSRREGVKELIGDAIRNAAMRFGVALDLWAKGELESGYCNSGYGNNRQRGSPSPGNFTPRDASPNGLSNGSHNGLHAGQPPPRRAEWYPGSGSANTALHGASEVPNVQRENEVTAERDAGTDGLSDAESISEVQRAMIFALSISLWPDRGRADGEIAKLVGKKPSLLSRQEAEAAIAKLKQLQANREARQEAGHQRQGSLDGTLACFNAYGQL